MKLKYVDALQRSLIIVHLIIIVPGELKLYLLKENPLSHIFKMVIKLT